MSTYTHVHREREREREKERETREGRIVKKQKCKRQKLKARREWKKVRGRL